ncbi:g578 [Coccomyxa viridis]|uniref:G578 protein n=1 Tax=Coccomyxa viridis TaxID=1274662 RepID=A0ABP1FMS3_9CHLO
MLCRSIASILRTSGDLYRRLDVNLQGMVPVVTPGDSAVTAMHLGDLQCWAQARAPYVHELTLRVTDGWELLAGVTLERLLRACSGTQTLYIHHLGGYKHWLPSIFELRHLRELTVTAGSTWVRLPQEFCHLTNLERLTIQMRIEGGRQVAQGFVPIELLSCIRLKHLSFIGCQGLFLPPVVGELMALESLTVNDTDWADTREAIHQATFQRGSFSTFSLTALDLSSCNLDALPFQMCHLEKLESLVLSDNNLCDVPRLLAAFLRRLRFIDLSRNRFKRIPPVLAALTGLQSVDLSGNVDLEVSPPDTRGERNAASRPLQHSLSLTQLVYALPELRSLNVRKAANDRDSRRPDLWTPACYSSLSEIMRAMRKHSPWCNLETFVCDPVPMPHDSTSWLGTALAE